MQQLLDHTAKETPKLVEDLVPKVIPIGILQKVLHNLLDESMHIRDMRTILEAIAEHIVRTQDIDELTSAVRIALGRAIVHQLFPGEDELQVITLEPQLENILLSAASGKSQGGLEPGLAERLLQQAGKARRRDGKSGAQHGADLPGPAAPDAVAFPAPRSAPGLRVISHNEIPDSKTIRIVGVIGAQ